MPRKDISRSTIERKKRKISEEQNIKKKSYDPARGRSCLNIRASFQRWRELREWEGFESDVEVALFFLDW